MEGPRSTTSMTVHDAIRTRRTIHRYRRDPVPLDVVRRAVEGAVLAPNHRLTEPWRFLLLGRQARAPLADFAVRRKTEAADAPPPPEIEARIRAKVLDPPLALLVQCSVSDDPIRQSEDRSAVACALQNLALSLHAEGIGTKWSSGGLVRDPRTLELFALDPAEGRVEGIVWIGYPAEVPEAPARSPLGAVYRERLDG